MNRSQARKIAEQITNEELKFMFQNAKDGIKNWYECSTVNKSMTKGSAWNIWAKDFDINQNYHIMAKQNMVREFGKYLPEYLKISPVANKVHLNSPIHQVPNFDNWN